MSSALLPLALVLRLAVPADPGFNLIVSRVGRQSHDVSCAQMQRWVNAHPQDPNAGRGLLWMAELRMADHRADLALPLLERAAHGYPESEWGHQAEKSVADILQMEHQYAQAIAIYDRLSKLPTDYWQYVGGMSELSARQARTRWYIFVVLALGLAAAVGVRVYRGRRTLWPLPEEFLYALPIALVMLVAALAQPHDEAHAVTMVALGGLALLYAHGVSMRARDLGTSARIVESLLGLGEAVALLYCAIVINDLWLKFSETLVSGAER